MPKSKWNKSLAQKINSSVKNPIEDIPQENKFWSCLKCGDCCRYSLITILEDEYFHLLKIFPKLKEIVFQVDLQQYSFLGKECPFYDSSLNLCSLSYEDKPSVCKHFPIISKNFDSSNQYFKSGLCSNPNPLDPKTRSKYIKILRGYKSKIPILIQKSKKKYSSQEDMIIDAIKYKISAIFKMQNKFSSLFDRKEIQPFQKIIEDDSYLNSLSINELDKWLEKSNHFLGEFEHNLEKYGTLFAQGRLDQEFNRIKENFALLSELRKFEPDEILISNYCQKYEISEKKLEEMEEWAESQSDEEFQKSYQDSLSYVDGFIRLFQNESDNNQ